MINRLQEFRKLALNNGHEHISDSSQLKAKSSKEDPTDYEGMLEDIMPKVKAVVVMMNKMETNNQQMS